MTLLEEFQERMVRHHLTPTWAYYQQLVSTTPQICYRPYLWQGGLLAAVVKDAGELVDLARGGERRSFEVVNPDLRHLHGTTHTLAAALQLVQPGEIAPPHRHLANAIRFIVKGAGGYTAVEGERLYMGDWDLILTPSWTWHAHGNETGQPIVWLDTLDYPLQKLLQLSFFEPGAEAQLPSRPLGFTSHHVGAVRPAWKSYPNDIPAVTYKWDDVRVAMAAMSKEEGSPADGILFEYVNPFTQGPVLPTIGCYAQMLRPAEHTAACRSTASSVYYVLQGAGHSVLGGQRFDWAAGDIFMVPPWTWAEHVNQAHGDALFFKVSDAPIVRTLKLWREEVVGQGPGRAQAVQGTFVPLEWKQWRTA